MTPEIALTGISARVFARCCGAALLALTLLAGCERQPPPTVVLYTSVDEEFARRVVADFERETGIRVQAKYDSEAGKTTGFLMLLRREAANPRCDVWWSSEIYGTIELADEGVLAEYDSPAAADLDPAWRDPGHRWTATAARARVLAFHTGRVNAAEVPTDLRQLAEPQWARRLAIANPQFGTTRGHLATLFLLWGDEPGRAFLTALRDGGVKLADGNAHAVRLLAAGEVDLCLTDTDDVWVAQERGVPVDLVYPTATADSGPLWIPCTTALVKGGPNPEAGRRLIDYLVSAKVERALAETDSRNVPVRPGLREELKLPGPAPEAADYTRSVQALPQAMEAARDILLR